MFAMSDLTYLIITIIVLLIIILLVYEFVEFPSISGADIGEGVGNAIFGSGKAIVDNFAKLIPPAKKAGETCKLHTDCEKNMAGQNTLACDNGICTQQLRDWAGIYYIPSECTDAPGRAPGTCSRGFSWPRKVDQECRLHTDCEGFKPGQNTLACDNGTCKQQLRDWAGIYYIPSECTDGPSRATGTCSRGFSWPRKVNQECRLNEDCDGFKPGQASLGCNNGTCQDMKRDWAGVYYNASECRGGPFSGPGTC